MNPLGRPAVLAPRTGCAGAGRGARDEYRISGARPASGAGGRADAGTRAGGCALRALLGPVPGWRWRREFHWWHWKNCS